MATEENDSEHLQEMEARAEDANPPDLDTDEEPPPAEDETMPPGEEREEIEADADAPLKRIDEDISGSEETEDMGDVESGDAA